MEVGIRELRDALSRHLASVRAGHTVTVTDHGRPVARIVPVGVPSKLEQWIAEGLVTAASTGSQGRRPLPPAIEADDTVSDLVGHQRR